MKTWRINKQVSKNNEKKKESGMAWRNIEESENNGMVV